MTPTAGTTTQKSLSSLTAAILTGDDSLESIADRNYRDRHCKEPEDDNGSYWMACCACFYLSVCSGLVWMLQCYSTLKSELSTQFQRLLAIQQGKESAGNLNDAKQQLSPINDTMAAEIRAETAPLPKRPQHLALVIPAACARALTTSSNGSSGHHDTDHTAQQKQRPDLSRQNKMTRVRIHGVSVSLSEEEAALHQLADWICWCLAAGIQQVTLYAPDIEDNDHNKRNQDNDDDDGNGTRDGLWQTRVNRLRKATARAERRVFGSDNKRHTMRWMVLEAPALERFTKSGAATPVSGDNSSFHDQDGYNSGTEDHLLALTGRSNSLQSHGSTDYDDQLREPDMRIFLASSAFGKEHIARVARVFGEESIVPDVDRFHTRVSVPYFTEPQLLITYDGLHSFAPWHLRLTEIYQVSSQVHSMEGALKRDHLITGLYRYAQCTQRFGK
ncbi:hypothetical protein BDF19DRAFT_423201 [Syncephalis fuscata]|nr:hypothetical protein BDF19DRAFT_423201 [Syncephalis fuscata]